MEIVFFVHPDFLGSQSMPRFANMLSEGMQKRGHETEILQPLPKFYKWSNVGLIKKWLGYIDQFIVFPSQVKKRLNNYSNETLFVFTDHALGPWVPIVSERAHVIHCHDFLAQSSALGEIKENPTGLTGRLYQKFIRNGYRKGKNFISVSKKTDKDLINFLPAEPQLHKVVYNGLNRQFIPFNPADARDLFGKTTGIDLSRGYILHIGGNQWYKNRVGVIEIYESWRKMSGRELPLLLIGKDATPELSAKKESSRFAADIFFLTHVADDQLQLAYAGASLLLFPSLAEGFGWPIAEAMASGCPVVTTNDAPMTEVAADAAFLIDRRPESEKSIAAWADNAAQVVNKVINMTSAAREAVVKAGLENAQRFDAEIALDKIEKIYKTVLTADRTTSN